MTILYCAIDQRVPGTTGGSIHVRAVADGLAALGHEVHVLAAPGPGGFPAGRPRWHQVGAPLGRPHLRLLRAPAVARIARRICPDVVMERYHNFGGEGVLAARAVGARAVLEVNAPVIDYPGSPKQRLDRACLVEPMRRWREWICRRADVLLTPSAAIVPRWIPRDRTVEIEWGADTEAFHPGAAGPVPFARRPGRALAVFAGAFRAWHGAVRLVEAMAALRAGGCATVDAVLIGDGPELARARAAATGLHGITFTGAVRHERVPACLAAADIGVAPFDVGAHPPLALGFYWSPLKVFEYMAAGLPVIVPAIDRLRSIVRDGQEGLLYDASQPGALAGALARLANDPARPDMGSRARARVVQHFSWAAHCRRLDEVLKGLLRGGRV